LDSLPSIRNNLVWRINDGSKARIGLDPCTGGGERFQLSGDLIQNLNSHDIKVLEHIADQMNTTIFSQGWKYAQQLDIPPLWHGEWKDYINALTESHIKIKEGLNELVWCLAENGIYTPKAGYLKLISSK